MVLPFQEGCFPAKQSIRRKLTDDSYWNSPYKPEKYNFVQAATDAGYSVFFYDRLGTGSSTK